MPHPPQHQERRLRTALLIERLIDRGDYATYREAFIWVVTRARAKAVATGWDRGEPATLYSAYRQWKRRNRHHIASQI